MHHEKDFYLSVTFLIGNDKVVDLNADEMKLAWWESHRWLKTHVSVTGTCFHTIGERVENNKHQTVYRP